MAPYLGNVPSNFNVTTNQIDNDAVTSAKIADGTIVNADINSAAAIAGTKISPDFGSQNTITTGTNTAASFIPTSSTVPTNGVYLPAANSVAISTNGSQRLTVSTTGVTSTLPVDVALGSVTAPTYSFTGDLNTGMWSPAADTVAISTGGSERVRVTSSGQWLVGTSSVFVSGANVQVAVNGGANANSTDILCLVRTGGTASASGEAGRSGWLTFGDSANFTLTGGIGGYRVTPATYASGLRFAVWNGTGGQAAGSAADLQEAMRINDAGELLVGYTTDNGAYKLQVNSQIFATSATVATSDGRYKENVATLGGCLDLVKALRPVSFNWKPQQDITRIDDEGNEVLVREGHNFPDGTQVGFIAQEVQQVLADKPWLGSVIKQNVRPAVTDNDGNELAPEEEFLGIAEGNLIAVLTSALQEAIAKIETLEARLTAAGIA